MADAIFDTLAGAINIGAGEGSTVKAPGSGTGDSTNGGGLVGAVFDPLLGVFTNLIETQAEILQLEKQADQLKAPTPEEQRAANAAKAKTGIFAGIDKNKLAAGGIVTGLLLIGLAIVR